VHAPWKVSTEGSLVSREVIVIMTAVTIALVHTLIVLQDTGILPEIRYV
jgi:hypothetical protein